MLDCDLHQLLDQFAKNNLARYRLRGLDYRRQIQLLDLRPDDGLSDEWRRLFAQLRVRQVKLGHLAVSTPAKIARAGVTKVSVSDRFETAPRIEPRGELVGQALVLRETMLAG